MTWRRTRPARGRGGRPRRPAPAHPLGYPDSGHWYVRISITPDWVLDYPEPNSARPDTMLALPLEQNKTWQVFARGDTTVWATVVGKSDITVPAGSFRACWEVELEYSIPGGSYKTSYWYAEDVGWVRGRSRLSGGGRTFTTEQRLTGYEVKQPRLTCNPAIEPRGPFCRPFFLPRRSIGPARAGSRPWTLPCLISPASLV